MHSVPAGYPGASFDALNLLYQRGCPSLDDLRVMAMIESAGEAFYRGVAERITHPEAKKLLLTNAGDERRHAERLVQAFALLGGGTLTLPADHENPYAATLQAPPPEAVNADFFKGLAAAEDNGYDGYEGWAAAEPNPEVAALYRLNAREEKMHGLRDRKVIELIS